MSSCCLYHFNLENAESKLTLKQKFYQGTKQLFLSILVITVILGGLFLIKPNIESKGLLSYDLRLAEVKTAAIEPSELVSTKNSFEQYNQILGAEIKYFGDNAGEQVQVRASRFKNKNNNDQIKVSELIFVAKYDGQYTFAGRFSLDKMIVLFILFLIVVMIVTKLKGIGAILGLIFTTGVIFLFTIPWIVAGLNTFVLTAISSLLILGVGLFVAHGFKINSLLAFISSMFTILITYFISAWSINFINFTGLDSEEGRYIVLGEGLQNINLQGLFLLAIIIGTLGVLDDITTAQIAVVEELSKLDKKQTRISLFWRSMNVGTEHIISLVNTLVLAYVATGLPVIILRSIYSSQNAWSLLNDPLIIEEIVRSLAGSFALVIAVPIASILAAVFYSWLHSKKENLPEIEIITSKDDNLFKQLL
jgi:uncharacterized membrane protein